MAQCCSMAGMHKGSKAASSIQHSAVQLVISRFSCHVEGFPGVVVCSGPGSKLHLLAHGVDDAIEQVGAVLLESPPLQAGAKDDQRCHWSPLVEAQIHCTHKRHSAQTWSKGSEFLQLQIPLVEAQIHCTHKRHQPRPGA